MAFLSSDFQGKGFLSSLPSVLLTIVPPLDLLPDSLTVVSFKAATLEPHDTMPAGSHSCSCVRTQVPMPPLPFAVSSFQQILTEHLSLKDISLVGLGY